jgi:hypothetical protein
VVLWQAFQYTMIHGHYKEKEKPEVEPLEKE